MSVFSKIKLSKKAAKEHKVKVKEQEAEPTKPAYRHVPTHAAFDALNGAPPSWKHDDLPKIKEQHKRRSQMNLSRAQSSLSTVTFMNSGTESITQAPPLPRNSSYSSYNPAWFDRLGDGSQQYEGHTTRQPRQPRGHSYHEASIGPSPLASKVQSGEVSPVMSSGNSTNSNSHDSDHLEMAQAGRRISLRPQPIVYAEQNIFNTLHTSTGRKLGEAPLYDSPPIQIKTPVATITAAPPKQKKNRWSLIGRKNHSISAI